MKVSARRGLKLISSIAIAALALKILVDGPSIGLAQDVVASPTLPSRIFELSQSQFPKMVTDIVAELQLLDTTIPSQDVLKRFRRCLELVAQITRYRTAMETISAASNNKTYAAATVSEDALKLKGITPESVALKGLEAIRRGYWQGLDVDQFESFAATSAVFLAELDDPAHLALANHDLAILFARLGQKTLSFDRFKDAVQSVSSVSDLEARTKIEINLASEIAKSGAPRRFALLTALLKSNTRAQQQKLIETVANFTVESAISDKASEPINAVWKQRLSYLKNPVSDPELAVTLLSYAKSIDTSLPLVLLAGTIGQNHDALLHQVVQAFMSDGKGLKAVDLLSTLPDDIVDTEDYINLISYFADREHWEMVRNLGVELSQKAVAAKSTLTDEQQLGLSRDLFRAGQTDLLQLFFDNDLLPKLALQKDRYIGLARLNAALSVFGHGGSFQNLELNLDDADLKTLAQMIASAEIVVPPNLTMPEDLDVDIWRRAGKLFWGKNEQRTVVLDFAKSSAPDGLKLRLAVGATAADSFDAASESAQQLLSALQVGETMRPSSEQQKLDAALIDAGFGKKLNDRDEVTLFGSNIQFEGDYKARLSKYLLASATHGNFKAQTENLRKRPDYSGRVSAFRSLAILKAYKLDRANWLGADANENSQKVALEPVETDGPAEIYNSMVALKSTKAALLIKSAKRPEMPSYYPASSDVYAVMPRPSQGKSGVAIGGEGRIDRLTRFASEHYEIVSNLGVREHLYGAVGSITPRFIFVRSGVSSMGQLLQTVGHFNPELISEQDGNILLRAPLVIGPDATLVISGEEFKELRLSQQKSAFIINAGKIYFSDVEVTGFDEVRNTAATMPVGDPGIKFRPFILSWSASQTFAANSKFEALGYSAGSAYGFSLSSGPDDEIFEAAKPAAPTGLIVDSSFENLYYGFYAFEAEDVKLVGNEYRDGVIYGLDPHDRSRHLLMAFNSAYGTHKKHGIIISREVDDSYIIGNMSFDNAGTGIMLDRESVGTIVYANSLMNNKGDGFAALESPCALLSNNDVQGNGRIGIKVRNSWDIHIDGNIVRKNGGSGIEAYTDRLEDAVGSEARNFKEDPYSPIATLTIVRNRLQENLTAVRTNGVAVATLFDNKFVNQAPKLFAGDMKSLALDILIKSSQTPITVASNCIPKIPPRKACHLAEQGVVLSQSTNRDFRASTIAAAECFAKAKTDAGVIAKKVN
jgi:parallel beta-helix repeat protein